MRSFNTTTRRTQAVVINLVSLPINEKLDRSALANVLASNNAAHLALLRTSEQESFRDGRENAIWAKHLITTISHHAYPSFAAWYWLEPR